MKKLTVLLAILLPTSTISADEHYNPSTCVTKVRDKGLSPICEDLPGGLPYHCPYLTDYAAYQKKCQGKPMYAPVPVVLCRNGDHWKYYPPDELFSKCTPPWEPDTCFCCCSCFANDTMIAVPNGLKPIYTIPTGAEVLAAAVNEEGGGISLDWSAARVAVSEGTGSGGHQPFMVYVAFGDENSEVKDLICSPDQPFLLSSGKYTTAGRLVPGQELVDRNGRAVPVKLASIGSYNGGVHHIGTDEPWVGNPSGHLLLAEGVVAGDFKLQSRFDQLPDALKVEGYDSLPLLGTPEYDRRYAGTVERSSALFEFVQKGAEGPEVGQRQFPQGVFTTYRTAVSEVPFGAQALLTPKQAADVLENGIQVPLSNPIPKVLFDTVKGQFAGLFPDVHFYYDPLAVTPNLYAFEAYGEKVVQVNGGLARLKGFNYEGLAMAMAHGAGSFYGGEPKNALGYSAVGEADLYAFGVVASGNWIGTPLLTYLVAAIRQWEELFKLVSPKHAKGNSRDPLNDPSLACRIRTIQTAAAGGDLPECAGGKPLPKIRLDQATAPSDDKVILVFSLAVDPASAEDPSHYTLNPPARVTGAKRSTTTDFTVELTVELEAGRTYTVTARDLSSILGTGMDPAHDSTTFTAGGRLSETRCDLADCIRKLNERGLGPACDAVNSTTPCFRLLHDYVYHEQCSGEPIRTPVQVAACHNIQTGEWKFFPPSQFFTACDALKRQDPNWDYAFCFCCCGCLP